MDSIETRLEADGFYVSTTVGNSMFPMLRNRKDRVIVRPVGEHTLKRLDLPLYRRPDGKYVLHRIIGVRGDTYRIRGDNTYEVEIVPREWILGYVTEFYRAERHIFTDSRSYRAYARAWTAIYCLRRPFVAARRLALGAARRLGLKHRKSKSQSGADAPSDT